MIARRVVGKTSPSVAWRWRSPTTMTRRMQCRKSVSSSQRSAVAVVQSSATWSRVGASCSMTGPQLSHGQFRPAQDRGVLATYGMMATVQQRAWLSVEITPVIPEVKKAELEELLKKKENHPFTLIDVREESELKHGMIDHAVHIPLGEVQSALQLNDTAFEARYGAPKPEEDSLMVFYCRAGVRGEQAAAMAVHEGFTGAKNYRGSYRDWFGRDYPL